MIFLITLLQLSFTEKNTVSKNGMTVQWEFVNSKELKFKINTPSIGWAAIGINTKNKLVGSNLIMASTSKHGNVLSDRFVLGFAHHESMESLGASSKVELLSAKESKSGTEIIFLMETKAVDDYHFQLQEGKKIFLTIAYSHDDDFAHHSAMRTLVEIIL